MMRRSSGTAQALRETTGVLLLWMDSGHFVADPPPDHPLTPPATPITLGTPEQLRALRDMVREAS